MIAPPDGSLYQGDMEIPSLVEQNGVKLPVVCIDMKAFNSSEITSIILPESLLSIERHAFEDCINLQSIVIPNQVKSISTAAFQGCKKLEHVTLSSNLHSLGGFSFNGCSALETVILPNSLKMIGEYAFAVCGFKTFHFNQVKNLANGVLSNCHNLETVTIPNSVVSINKNVLFNNPKLKTILVETTEPPFVDGIFYWNKEQVNVFIPATAMDTYKSTPFWKDLKLNSY